MIKLFHLSWEYSIENRLKCAAYAVTALRDGCKIVLRRHAYQQWSAIDQTQYFGEA